MLPSAVSHFEANVWLLTGDTGSYLITTNELALPEELSQQLCRSSISSLHKFN